RLRCACGFRRHFSDDRLLLRLGVGRGYCSVLVVLVCHASFLRLLGEVIEQPGDQGIQRAIDQEKEQAKNRHRNNDHCGGGADFLERWVGDFAHFTAHIAEKSANVAPRALDLAADAGKPLVAGRRNCCCCLRHLAYATLLFLFLLFLSGSASPKLAGAEGFEPPSPVLETGSLTVELTPLDPLSY